MAPAIQAEFDMRAKRVAMITTGSGLDIQLFDQGSPDAAGLLRELHDEVLRPSFRPEEYVSPAVIKPDARLAVIARAGDGLVVGGATGEVYQDSGVLLLGYLAVRPGLRGQGIGGVLMTALRERWLQPDTVAVLEADDPRFHAPHPGYGDPAARLRFYGAFGVRLLAMPYFQPRLRPHLPRAAHMFLGVIPPPGATLPDEMPSAPVGAFLREYFADSEGAAVCRDAEFLRLLDACRAPAIALVAAAEFERIPAG
jgi:predicted N-acetyltransferase YhbS